MRAAQRFLSVMARNRGLAHETGAVAPVAMVHAVQEAANAMHQRAARQGLVQVFRRARGSPETNRDRPGTVKPVPVNQIR